jgi:hypothetical protein
MQITRSVIQNRLIWPEHSLSLRHKKWHVQLTFAAGFSFSIHFLKDLNELYVVLGWFMIVIEKWEGKTRFT